MNYFIMRQDFRIVNTPQLILPKSLQRTIITAEWIINTKKAEVIYVKEQWNVEYPGYIDAPFKLVSNDLKRVLSKYQQGILFKPAILIEKQKNQQMEYHFMIAPEIECSAITSKHISAGFQTDFVLDENKVKPLRVFSAKDFEQHLIVRLDVAESILRRKIYGIWYEKVSVI